MSLLKSGRLFCSTSLKIDKFLAAEYISTLNELMKTQDNIRGIDLTKSGESLDWKVKSNSFPAGPLSNATESKFSAGIT